MSCYEKILEEALRGYYESCIVAIEDNQIETVTALPVSSNQISVSLFFFLIKGIVCCTI